MKLRQIITLLEENNLAYSGRHKAPMNDGESAPLYDATLLYPESIYSSNGYKLFPSGLGTSMDKASWGLSLRQEINPIIN